MQHHRYSIIGSTRESSPGAIPLAAIAQLGERQTEDLKVPGSIPGLGSLELAPSNCVGEGTKIQKKNYWANF